MFSGRVCGHQLCALNFRIGRFNYRRAAQFNDNNHGNRTEKSEQQRWRTNETDEKIKRVCALSLVPQCSPRSMVTVRARNSIRWTYYSFLFFFAVVVRLLHKWKMRRIDARKFAQIFFRTNDRELNVTLTTESCTELIFWTCVRCGRWYTTFLFGR